MVSIRVLSHDDILDDPVGFLLVSQSLFSIQNFQKGLLYS